MSRAQPSGEASGEGGLDTVPDGDVIALDDMDAQVSAVFRSGEGRSGAGARPEDSLPARRAFDEEITRKQHAPRVRTREEEPSDDLAALFRMSAEGETAVDERSHDLGSDFTDDFADTLLFGKKPPPDDEIDQ